MASRRTTGVADARAETEGQAGGDATPPDFPRPVAGGSETMWNPGDGHDGFPRYSPLRQAMASNSNGSDGDESGHESVSDRDRPPLPRPLRVTRCPHYINLADGSVTPLTRVNNRVLGLTLLLPCVPCLRPRPTLAHHVR